MYPIFGDGDDLTLIKVAVRPKMHEELTVLTLASVWRFSPDTELRTKGLLVDMTIMDMTEMWLIRSAFTHRHEWVANKVAGVNHRQI